MHIYHLKFVNMSIQIDIGRRIRQARKTKGLTQQELAEALGFDRSFLSKIEAGLSDVTSSMLYDIAKYLDVSVAALYGEEPSPVLEREVKRLSELLETLSPDEVVIIKKVMYAFVESNKFRHKAVS
ncbi:helix-turn-helix domain-containing protein [Beggiatoa leptomitoformis]|uniref:Helix-turn-helix domain-containing protein n=1 Tax=Beggiatoa leptomitoformis TaxID=288004 RepID=A0A2N9YCS8_9GAMM|nr:helix-turn-helix transcriptional regulator [Beggiatoa leptomitoformis]AUI68278.1 helix-turn-helix domain-containing protein [Beggiatoa leptomitoformis]QGX03427.1 helix-turn-helix domain-containing protein [Beggiatoa leptomitoformis]